MRALTVVVPIATAAFDRLRDCRLPYERPRRRKERGRFYLNFRADERSRPLAEKNFR